MKWFILFVVALSTTFAQTNKQEIQSEMLRGIKLSDDTMTEISAPGKKNAGKAVLYSLLLPGMGELYAEGFDEGKYSLISEGALWLTYYGFQQYGTWLQNDARSFASTHAGATIAGKNDAYFVNLGNFGDTYEYNEKKLRDRDIEKLYSVNSSYYWKWDSDANRRQYRALRVSSDKVFNNGKFIVGAIIVNHILSAVNAARLVRTFNTHSTGKLESWRIESSLQGRGALPDGIALSLIHHF